MNSAAVVAKLQDHGVLFDPGLSQTELSDVESTFDFTFPPDLAALLRTALPVSHGFVNWRRGECGPIRDAMDWPFDGFCYDIEHHRFWPEKWGDPPEELSDRFRRAGEILGMAPTLIPICGHRFIPESPAEEGNPVFSVYHADVIYYGFDLMDYLEKELKCDLGRGERPKEARQIPFWSEMAKP